MRFGGPLGLVLRFLQVEQTGPEDAHGLGLVLDLALLVLAVDDKPARKVGDPNGRIRRVDALSAGPAGAHDVDAEVLGADVHLRLLRLRQDGHGHGTRMDAPGTLGLGNTLDAVYAALPAQLS